MGGTASERSSGHCARLWTSVGHWRDGKNLERHTSDVGAHMRHGSSGSRDRRSAVGLVIASTTPTFAMHSERDSLRRPCSMGSRRTERAKCAASEASSWMGGATTMGGIRVGKGLELRSQCSMEHEGQPCGCAAAGLVKGVHTACAGFGHYGITPAF